MHLTARSFVAIVLLQQKSAQVLTCQLLSRDTIEAQSLNTPMPLLSSVIQLR